MSTAVIYFPTNYTSFTNMITLSDLLTDEIENIFVIPEHLQLRIPQKLFDASNRRFYFVGGPSKARSSLRSRVIAGSRRLLKHNKIINNLFEKVRNKLEGSVLKNRHISFIKRKVYKYEQLLRTLMEKYHFSSAVFYDDRSDLLSLVALKRFKENNVKCIVPCFGYTAGAADLMNYRKNDSRYLIDSHLGFPCSQSTFCLEYEGKCYSYYTRNWILALKDDNILSMNPWVMGGGGADYLLVQGHAQYKRLVSLGCDPDKLVITGLPAYDSLHQATKNVSTLRKLLTSDKKISSPIVVVALPQLAEHSILSWSDHWLEIKYLCSILQKSGVRALLSLHPKMDPKRYAFLQEFGHVISEEALKDILPAADIFIATFSSTLAWSSLLKIDTLVVDFYELGYVDWDGTEGFTICRDKTVFEKSLQNLLVTVNEKKPNLTDVKFPLKEQDVLFDGKCGLRVKNFLSHGL